MVHAPEVRGTCSVCTQNFTYAAFEEHSDSRKLRGPGNPWKSRRTGHVCGSVCAHFIVADLLGGSDSDGSELSYAIDAPGLELSGDEYHEEHSDSESESLSSEDDGHVAADDPSEVNVPAPFFIFSCYY